MMFRDRLDYMYSTHSILSKALLFVTVMVSKNNAKFKRTSERDLNHLLLLLFEFYILKVYKTRGRANLGELYYLQSYYRVKGDFKTAA